tara:strand:- start:248 stop:427 length:180 start_codon:yes stop_codon:yes gene_type:complete
MNKLNSLKDSSFKKNDSNDVNQRINENTIKHEKVLCNHCGRTATNGIRCLGICVSDSDY